MNARQAVCRLQTASWCWGSGTPALHSLPGAAAASAGLSCSWAREAAQEGLQGGSASPWLPGPCRDTAGTLVCHRAVPKGWGSSEPTELRMKGWCPPSHQTQSTGALPGALLSGRKGRVELHGCAVSIQQVSGHGCHCQVAAVGTVLCFLGESGVMLLGRYWLCLGQEEAFLRRKIAFCVLSSCQNLGSGADL